MDLDGDGDLDVLYTNGDTLDRFLLKPYHGIHWLENRGQFPFAHHHLAAMPGVMRAVAADFTGDGKLDVVAVSDLPAEGFPDREKKQLDSVVLLEQTAPGTFARHSLETATCDHLTCAAGDLYGEGKAHLVVGNHYFGKSPPRPDAVTVWRSLGRAAGPPEKSR